MYGVCIGYRSYITIIKELRGNEQTGKKQSDLGLHCSSRPFWQAASV